MEHFYQNLEGENWFDYEDFYAEMVRLRSSGSLFVELGAWKGKSTCFMAVEIINSGKDIRFDTIDDWSQGGTRDEFSNNIKLIRKNINVINGITWEVAKNYEDKSIDFCFIDASHDYESKVKDIKAYLPKMKKGGILAGHDYTMNMDDYNKTYDAVNDTLGEENIFVRRNIWIYNT